MFDPKVLFDPEVFYSLGTIGILILVDVALGVLGGFVKGEFDVRKLPSFLKQNVLPYVGGLLIVALVAKNPEMKAVFVASAAAVGAKFLADVKDKVASLIRN